MKFIGGLILLAFSAITLLGFEPLGGGRRGHVPADARRGPGGLFFWHGGYMGGK